MTDDEDELDDFEPTTDEEIEDQDDAEDAADFYAWLDNQTTVGESDTGRPMTEEDTDARGPEPVRDGDEFNTGRADAQSVGTEIRAKVKRGTGTRDQDEIVIKGRGVNAQEAADDFEQALQRAEDGDWTDRLRALRSSEDD